MLQEARDPIDDVAEEIECIQQRAFDQAARLADATGDNNAVRDYLGLPEADPVPTVPLIPTQPGQPAPDGPPTSPTQAKPQPPASTQPPGATGQARAGGAGPS